MLDYFTRELVVLSPKDASINIVAMKPDESTVTIQNNTFDGNLSKASEWHSTKDSCLCQAFHLEQGR